MSAITRLFPTLLNSVSGVSTLTSKFLNAASKFHSLTNAGTSQLKPGGLFLILLLGVSSKYIFQDPPKGKRIKKAWLES
ncbi:hypothetical protein NQ317_013367 [Molorchus minor]|uniref:Uncharacterized protein n=1 Tax=Molorchus minor TaxID=1323400 RepID=A0ABQ9J1Z9_9CUCU|nr:hypothetical protein NQ317_013367 [Molorchus minor]